MDHVTPSLALATGVSAGITEAAVIVPFELVKVRLQDKANVSKSCKYSQGLTFSFRRISIRMQRMR